MRLHANGTKTLSNANIQRCRTPTTEHFRWWNSLCTITSVYVMLMMFDFRLQQNSVLCVKDFCWFFFFFAECHRECQNRNDFYCCFTLRTTTRDALSIIVTAENFVSFEFDLFLRMKTIKWQNSETNESIQEICRQNW